MWTDRAFGAFAARTIVVLDAAYVVVGSIGFLIGRSRLDVPTAPLLQEPYLGILHALILLAAPAVVLLFTAIEADADRKFLGRAAARFAIAAATLTSAVHFVALAIVRHLAVAEDPAFALLSATRWPSLLLAVDILAWGPLLGAALLCAAGGYSGDASARGLRRIMTASGALCVVGGLGPITGAMWLAFAGVIGWVFGFALACIVLARRFARRSEVADVSQ